MTTPLSAASANQLPLSALHLDPQNPRLPAELHSANEDELLVFIAETYDALAVARSIALHGYFASEPLIVIPHGNHEYLVVEGNRRLAALRILSDPSLADNLDDAAEWRTLAEGVQLPDMIPVVVAPSRQAVAPIIGYRHISGIEPWEPYAKARFIAALVLDGMTFDQVGSIVGERSTDIAAHYRNHAIVDQARDQFNADTTPVTRRFGVFTRAMNSYALRTYIGAPAPSEVTPGRRPLPNDRGDNVKELVSWLFGDGDNPPVISESRDLTDLGTVVASQDGLKVLKATRDLEAAFVAAGGLRERLLRRLNNALNNLIAAREDMPAYANDNEVQELLAQCRDALQQLSEPDVEN